MLDEVMIILGRISSELDTEWIRSVFSSTVALYEGRFPGYLACSTQYHDLRHSAGCFLAMARLSHGAALDGKQITPRNILLGLTAALLHDVGYIRRKDEGNDPAPRHGADHVQQTLAFAQRHGREYGLTADEIGALQKMVLCTDLTVQPSDISFPSEELALLGKMLGSADLLGQMADRTYLEKLLFLYHEFKEADIGDYQSELDLLHKTVGFYDRMYKRLQQGLEQTDRFMTPHFAERWGIARNLYHVAMERHRVYLQKVLQGSSTEIDAHLRRENIVARVRKKYGPDNP
jgi:hypothetical protein